ncbi:hypothetical protein BDQ12DRAFT_348414 [Crucibulum laeve]|uniref:Methyltransferase-domain-containing protein n=1 Tax=Crucibulum laeve TaxID=68775 RepID=A0A5C3MBZ5_9AGAR|nr:hypothetical protein BDQ12DRAFT_348414 [Crucibulum laeve]
MTVLDSSLFELLRGFSCLKPPNSLLFPQDFSLPAVHSFLLDNILLNPHFQAYPPSAQYQKQFWKWAIAHLERMPQPENEEDEVEIDPQIYEHYLELLPPSGPALGSSQPSTRSQICGRSLPMTQLPPSQSFLTHYWRPAGIPKQNEGSTVNLEEYRVATLLESRTTIESGTTGLRTWLASFLLSQYLILHPEILNGKRVLELGSGVGFLGIIAASLQNISGSASSSSLWLTDVNDEVLARCKYNLTLPCNMSEHPNIHYRNIDWSASVDQEQYQSLASVLNDEIAPDVILGADIVFDPSLILALIGVLKLVLQPGSKQKSKYALIALTIRNESTIGRFLEEAQNQSVRFEEVPIDFDRTTFSETIESAHAQDNIKVFKFTL